MGYYGVLVKDFLPENVERFRFLTRKSVRPGPVVAFALGSVNYGSRTVVGYTYSDRTKRWIKGIHPIPRVIFNRADIPNIKHTRLWIVTKGRIFNTHNWLSKAQIHRILSRKQEFHDILPPTHFLRSTSLSSLVDKYGSVYLKPTRRSKGKGIIRVWRSSLGYRYSYMIDGHQYQGGSRTIGTVSSRIRRIMGKDKYLAQKDVRLASTNRSKFDFRIITARTPNDGWTFICGYAKHAARRATVTNIDQGARVVSGRKTLTACFGDQGQEIYDQLQSISINVSEEISRYYKNMALLGLDFGVDQGGHIWFLEANALPGLIRYTRTNKLARAIWSYAKSLI